MAAGFNIPAALNTVSLLLVVLSCAGYGVTIIRLTQCAPLVQLQAQPVASNPTGICQSLVLIHAGYTCQEFKVPTSDGFLLAVQRIASKAAAPMKGPAFLYHGLMQGGDIWVLNGPQRSLAFVLADSGYEVWIGSTRSSKFSYGHVMFRRSDPAYWNWAWDDLVQQDLPSMLRFVHAQSRQTIYFVGYSQGTMTGFAAFTRSDVSSLVRRAAMLSPIMYLNHVSSPVAAAVAWLFLDKVLLTAGVHQFNISDDGGKQVIDSVCKNMNRPNCYSDLLSLVTGPNCCIDKTLISFYNKFELQTTSMRNLAQMAQLLRTGRFGMYDYGWFRNLLRYGDFFPPEYELAAIPSRLRFLVAHGGRDALADGADVRHLLQVLPADAAQALLVPQFAHGDFVLGSSAKSLVYDNLLLFFDSSP